jgi:hypothetical protein
MATDWALGSAKQSRTQTSMQGVASMELRHRVGLPGFSLRCSAQMATEGLAEDSMLQRIPIILKSQNGFMLELVVPPRKGFEEVRLDVRWHLGAVAKLVFILTGQAVYGSFWGMFCPWHSQVDSWLRGFSVP